MLQQMYYVASVPWAGTARGLGEGGPHVRAGSEAGVAAGAEHKAVSMGVAASAEHEAIIHGRARGAEHEGLHP
jgi:hypothetical protein